MPPTIFIVPGLWEGPTSFEPLKSILERHGFPTFATSLKSTGTTAPGNPTMSDDLAAIRADLENSVEEAGSQGVIAVAHSAGGFLGCSAMEGLSAAARKSAGKEGGVLKIVFIAAGIAPEGHDSFGGPFIVEQDDGSAVCIDSKNSLFHDLTPEEADEWQSKIQVQPALDSWKVKIPYCGWRDIPSVYIICELDRLLPATLQEQIGSLTQSRIVRIKAGHMAQLSATEEVASIIEEVANSLDR